MVTARGMATSALKSALALVLLAQASDSWGQPAGWATPPPVVAPAQPGVVVGVGVQPPPPVVLQGPARPPGVVVGMQPPPPVVVQGPAQPPAVVGPAAQVGVPVAACVRRTGIFAWSCAGPLPGMTCVQTLETADPNTWHDNYVCSMIPLGLRWSSAGPIHGMRCTQLYEYADPHTWNDNYLCIPSVSNVHLAWSEAGPLAGMQCVQFLEPSDPHTWNDNYLCWVVAR